MSFRAKFKVQSVLQYEGGEAIKAAPVTNCSDENKSFSTYTPSGSLDISITNPALTGVLKPGQEFYLDFTPVDPVKA